MFWWSGSLWVSPGRGYQREALEQSQDTGDPLPHANGSSTKKDLSVGERRCRDCTIKDHKKEARMEVCCSPRVVA